MGVQVCGGIQSREASQVIKLKLQSAIYHRLNVCARFEPHAVDGENAKCFSNV